ncbi:CLUMA_CG017584, isoform A [Clunio marinus]|uniref:CLUMA_CG017584, isoform A n=1 Tax=Clunio marinus TaxID=568069 RepID=A0A1J1IWM7_9DIPT|nr:CLUMA_CG017584, isoform A [Clunio marinus]
MLPAKAVFFSVFIFCLQKLAVESSKIDSSKYSRIQTRGSCQEDVESKPIILPHIESSVKPGNENQILIFPSSYPYFTVRCPKHETNDDDDIKNLIMIIESVKVNINQLSGKIEILSELLMKPPYCMNKPPTKTSIEPSTKPITKQPTKLSTRKPTKPMKLPTRRPIQLPTRRPTKLPTRQPIKLPTRRPTKLPTRQPTRPQIKPTSKPKTKSTTKALPKQPTKPLIPIDPNKSEDCVKVKCKGRYCPAETVKCKYTEQALEPGNYSIRRTYVCYNKNEIVLKNITSIAKNYKEGQSFKFTETFGGKDLKRVKKKCKQYDVSGETLILRKFHEENKNNSITL